MAGVLSSSGALAGDAGVLGRQEETPEAAGLWSGLLEAWTAEFKPSTDLSCWHGSDKP